MDIGTRFYRVKARPWVRTEDGRRRMTSSVSAAPADPLAAQANLSASCFP